MAREIVENFFERRFEGCNTADGGYKPEPAATIFTVDRFRPAYNRLLLKRLPPPKEGLIVRPQIAEEQSEYGYVVRAGCECETCQVGDVAKFSKHSGPEEIHFEDERPGDEYIVVYKEDIRGYFELGDAGD